MASTDQTWEAEVAGRTHRVTATGGVVHHVTWFVDDVEVASRKSSDETLRLSADGVGRLTAKFATMGSARRATVHVEGHDDVDLVPTPGSPAARWEQRLLEHPTRTAVLAGLGSAGGIVAGLVAAAAVAFLVRLLPDLPDLPSIPFPDLPDLPDLPSIPFPDLPSIPFPDLPSIPFPDLPELPDLPGWTRYVVTVLVAVLLAVVEVRRRRRQEVARLQAGQRAQQGDQEGDPDDGGSGTVER